jgi:Arc/MetJ family transcription regulator
MGDHPYYFIAIWADAHIPASNNSSTMKMTIEIPEDVLAELMQLTGHQTKRDAVEFALREAARRAKWRRADQGSGSDYSLYHGSSGIILLLLELHAATGDPAALAKAYRFAGDPRDVQTDERLYDLAQDPQGIYDCTHCFSCVDACPKGVAPMDQIMRLRRLAGDAGGYLNSSRLKGIHLAMKTGMLAADAAH